MYEGSLDSIREHLVFPITRMLLIVYFAPPLLSFIKIFFGYEMLNL